MKLADCDKKLVDGADEKIQLLDVSATVFECCKRAR